MDHTRGGFVGVDSETEEWLAEALVQIWQRLITERRGGRVQLGLSEDRKLRGSYTTSTQHNTSEGTDEGDVVTSCQHRREALMVTHLFRLWSRTDNRTVRQKTTTKLWFKDGDRLVNKLETREWKESVESVCINKTTSLSFSTLNMQVQQPTRPTAPSHSISMLREFAFGSWPTSKSSGTSGWNEATRLLIWASSVSFGGFTIVCMYFRGVSVLLKCSGSMLSSPSSPHHGLFTALTQNLWKTTARVSGERAFDVCTS